MIKAIETTYKGYRFRSRVEARWAVFFDTLDIRWEYEKEGFDLGIAGPYLPDFWLPDLDLWVEIKGQDPTPNECKKAEALCRMTDATVAIFSGSPWFNIARAYYFKYVDEETGISEVADTGWWYPGAEKDGYDYEKEDGEGCYYQGWHTWGIGEVSGKPEIICLVDRDDVRAAQLVGHAYSAARSARFEHGETP